MATNFKFYNTESTSIVNSPVVCPVQTVSCGNWLSGSSTFSTKTNTTAAIKSDGTLWTWGSNNNGQLGNDNTITRSSPVQIVAAGTNWSQVSVGCEFMAAIKTDGTLWGWGLNTCGQLGNNSSGIDRSSPVQTVSTGTNWCRVSAGWFHTAAIKTDGTLWLWGYNAFYGALGNNSLVSQQSPVQTVTQGTNWCQVSAGTYSSAAVKTDGTLWLWGNNCFGQLGNNTTVEVSSPIQTVATGANWKQVSLGVGGGSVTIFDIAAAAVKTDGTLWTWGSNCSGQLGNNSFIRRSSPVQTVATGTNWKEVSFGRSVVGAIKTDGTLWMWGCGSGQEQGGMLGINGQNDVSSPVQTVATGLCWTQISIGNTAMALTSSNTLYLWGTNTFGQIGCDPGFISTICNLIEFDDVFVKRDLFDRQGQLFTWGINDFGQLGNNNTIDRSSPVQTVATGTNWKQVSSKNVTTAAIKIDGTLWSWGCNTWGQLGNNSIIDRSSPVQTVSTGTNWKQVSAGVYHVASIKSDGTLWLWGDNSNGSLGNNSTVNCFPSPVQTVSTGTNWCQVSSGEQVTAAIKTDGTLWVWGYNFGGNGLGTNNTICYSSPVQTVAQGNNWKQVILGDGYISAAIKTDGTLWMWGCNLFGPLGNNDTIDRSSPVQTVATGTNWKQVSVNSLTSAAIKTDGTLWLWGSNNQRQLGTNNVISRSSPVQTISTGTNWKKVASGYTTVAAIKTDGTLWVWGGNNCGQLGTDNTISRSSPVQTISAGNRWYDVSASVYYGVQAIQENTI